MAKKSIYTKKLGHTVAKSAQVLDTKTFHVISGESRTWSVIAEGRTRAIKIFPTQAEAINFAKETASRKTGEVIVHASTGQVKDTISFIK